MRPLYNTLSVSGNGVRVMVVVPEGAAQNPATSNVTVHRIVLPCAPDSKLVNDVTTHSYVIVGSVVDIGNVLICRTHGGANLSDFDHVMRGYIAQFLRRNGG